MTWKIVGASVLGTSHERTNKPCQDSFKIVYDVDASADIVYCFVSDGAGSAIEGGTGANLVCDNAVNFCRERLKTSDLSESFGYELCEYLNELVVFEAESTGLTARDFSCTFLGLIIVQQKVLYIQIGDGAIITRHNFDHPIYSVVFWPHKGEYANATYFLTDGDYVKHLAISLKEEVPTSFAVLTDGLEHLSLSNESLSVHAPFFNSMFFALRKASTKQEVEVLNNKLRDYLSSSVINERTDDDKTLVLISMEYES